MKPSNLCLTSWSNFTWKPFGSTSGIPSWLPLGWQQTQQGSKSSNRRWKRTGLLRVSIRFTLLSAPVKSPTEFAWQRRFPVDFHPISCHFHPAMNATHIIRIRFFGDWISDIVRFLNFLASLPQFSDGWENRRSTLFTLYVPMRKDIMLTKGRWRPALNGLAPKRHPRRCVRQTNSNFIDRQEFQQHPEGCLRVFHF